VRGSTLISGEREQAYVLKVLRCCPLVLLVKAGWRQGRAAGSGEGTVIGRELCYYTVEKLFPDFFFFWGGGVSEHFLS